MNEQDFMGRYLICLIICLQATTLKSQITSREVRGVVQDSSGTPLVGVTVRLYAESDTMMSSTNEHGRFLFGKVASTNFKLTFSLIGFQIYERTYVSDILLPITELVTVNLKEQPSELQEVVVYGVVPMLIKPDTIQYNANAYKVRDDALVEEMLKQMPGFQVSRNGNISAQGQSVTRARVNGKDFFGGDVITATRNLPAYLVESIQVIDDYGDQANITGIKIGEPEKVINIILKKDKNRGMFGQATASGGTQNRHLGSFSANKFNDSKQLSILASTNNTNTSLFSFGDVSGAGTRTNPDINSMIDAGDGFNSSYSAGVNFRDEIGKFTIYGGYTYVQRDNHTESETSVESYYQLNRKILSLDEVKANSSQKRHKLSWNMEMDIDSMNYLKITPTLSHTSNNASSNSNSIITDNWVRTLRNYNSENNSRSPNAEMDVLFNHKFDKQGRNLSASIKIDYIGSKKTTDIIDRSDVIDDSYIINPRSSDTLFQQQNNNSNTTGLSGTISYTEPINERSFMDFQYTFNRMNIENDRMVYDWGDLFNRRRYVDSLSVDYAYLSQLNQFGLNYHLDGKHTKYIIGFAVQPTDLSGNTTQGDISTRLTRVNLVPSMRFQYQLSNSSNLSLIYKGQNNQPGFLQVLPIRDMSNPQFIVEGNPNLRAEFINTVSMQYRNFSIQRGSSFFLNLNYTHISDKVVSNRFRIPNSTQQETNFLNANGYFDIRTYYHFSSPLSGGAMTLNLSGNADYTHNISFVDDVRNLGKNLVLGQSAQLLFQLEDFLETDARASYNVDKINYSIPFLGDIEAQNFNFGAGTKAYLKNNWVLSLDFAKQFNTGYENVGNVNPTLMNVYIEKSFLKNEMASIRLQGFDLFNQNTGISREISGNDIFDVRSNRLARYFLLSLNFRFQKFPPKG
ncbi:TonB-dependent receptor [Olivibacter sitiensis]|uniref:TonB-dependent receptor n=1 Tax=Olivibacter sitiensis TaxID=376470 RepID=UPI0004814DE1|nr:TonB-dependent receptor [Olivibacter sitiensis]